MPAFRLNFLFSIRMKRGIALVLILVILMQSGVMLLLTFLQQEAVNTGMQAYLQSPSAKTEIISMKLSDYRKASEGNEIQWKGAMYDIKSIRSCGDQVKLTVCRDHLEEKIFSLLNALIRQLPKKRPSQLFGSPVIKMQNDDTIDLLLVDVVDALQDVSFDNHSGLPSQVFLERPCQPPDLIS